MQTASMNIAQVHQRMRPSRVSPGSSVPRTTACGQAGFDTIAHQELSHTGIGPDRTMGHYAHGMEPNHALRPRPELVEGRPRVHRRGSTLGTSPRAGKLTTGLARATTRTSTWKGFTWRTP